MNAQCIFKDTENYIKCKMLSYEHRVRLLCIFWQKFAISACIAAKIHMWVNELFFGNKILISACLRSIIVVKMCFPLDMPDKLKSNSY